MRYLRSSEVIKMLRIARGTLHKLIKTDIKFPTPTRIGNNLLFDLEEIKEYLRRNREEYERKCGRYY